MGWSYPHAVSLNPAYSVGQAGFAGLTDSPVVINSLILC